MTKIRGIYKIPAVNHTFFIVNSLEDFSDSTQTYRESKRRMAHFERILRSKDRTNLKEAQQWKLIIVEEQEFLRVIECSMPTKEVSSSQSRYNLKHLELLTINLLKTPVSPGDWTFSTPKKLSVIPEEDIIEVFI